MADRRSKVRRVAPKKKVALGPGIHAGVIELAGGSVFRVRTTVGTRVEAQLHAAVDRDLIEDCLRDGRPVLLVDGAQGPEILGAIQTRRVPTVSDAGALEVDATTIRLRATQKVELEVGDTVLALQKRGVIQMRGDKAVLDFSALVRVLAARVELP